MIAIAIALKMISMLMIVGSVIAVIVFMFPLALVQGNSMLPTLKNNEVLVMRRRIFPKEKLKIGKIYVYKRPNNNLVIIKRLTDYSDISEQCYFLGDNPEESYDSRDYGYIKAENIIAVLMWNSKYQLKQKGERR